MRYFSLIVFFTLILKSGYAQEYLWGDAVSRMDSLISIMPATSFTDEYVPPSPAQADVWAQVVNLVLNGDLISADAEAEEIGYSIIIFSDTTNLAEVTYYFLEKHPDSAHYWGTLVFNPNPVRSGLAIQVPHPLADLYTGHQGFDLFKRSSALLFCISGTHRCNSSDSTDCSGRTSVCSGLTNAKYRKSDQAHSVESVFQITTQVLLNHYPDMIFIQVHGFSRQPGDPDLIMSNGTKFTPRIDYLPALRDSMLKLNPFLKFKIAHKDWTWTKLIATSNTQGRLVNGSYNPCLLNPSSTTGKFLHIEQAPYLRFPKNWYLLNESVIKIFPADEFLASLVYMKAEQQKNDILVQWETASERGNYGFELQKRISGNEEWTYAAFLSGFNYPASYTYRDTFNGRDTIFYRLKQINTDGTYKILPPVAVTLQPSVLPVLYNNYPNPFNSSTTITFELPQAGEADISIYNTLGEKIQTLVSGVISAGMHKINFSAEDMAAGVYLCRFNSSGYTDIKKLILLK